jgi:hypothetical protein
MFYLVYLILIFIINVILALQCKKLKSNIIPILIVFEILFLVSIYFNPEFFIPEIGDKLTGIQIYICILATIITILNTIIFFNIKNGLIKSYLIISIFVILIIIMIFI